MGSDVEVAVGPGLQTIKVVDVEGDWHFAKRKDTGGWVNTGIFTQVWKAIANGWKSSSADWVVKVDADAVFVRSWGPRWCHQVECTLKIASMSSMATSETWR